MCLSVCRRRLYYLIIISRLCLDNFGIIRTNYRTSFSYRFICESLTKTATKVIRTFYVFRNINSEQNRSSEISVLPGGLEKFLKYTCRLFINCNLNKNRSLIPEIIRTSKRDCKGLLVYKIKKKVLGPFKVLYLS